MNASGISGLPFIHAANCAGCSVCCGEPCPLDFLSPIACGTKCLQTWCAAPDQNLKAGELVGILDGKLVGWAANKSNPEVEFAGILAVSTVTDSTGNVINRRIMTTFAGNCEGCQTSLYIIGTFMERDVSKNDRQALEDAISAGHVKRRLNLIVLG